MTEIVQSKKQEKEAENRYKSIQPKIKEIIKTLGENVTREGLRDTPMRYAKAMDYLTSGYRQCVKTVVGNGIFKAESQELVIVKDIELYSMCEHHMLPFFGKAHIGYIPNKKIIGLSKLPRIVDLFSRRLQVQERLTTQIADAVMDVLDPMGVAVVIEAAHFCMMMRGVEKQNSKTMTSAMRGEFTHNFNSRNEFLKLIRT